MSRLPAMLWLPLVVLLVSVLAVLKAPALPINDPALFEYYGRALVDGHRLYGDITDVKLPSIYLINALLQALFGNNYLLHTCAEVALNIVSIGLFAYFLRAYEVRSWQWGTALFAIVYSLIFPQLDYPQHYAVLLILIAYCIGLRASYAEAGIVLALAVTLWTPAVFMCIPLLVMGCSRAEQRALILGGLGAAVIYYATFALTLGADWILKPLALWPANFANNGLLSNLLQLRVTVSSSALGPAVGALLALLLATVRRPQDKAQRFALWWSACALAGTALPPRFTEHFFLPSVPALAMAVAAFGFPSRAALRRPLALVAAAVCAYFAVRSDLIVSRSNQLYAAYIQNVGYWVTSDAGYERVMWTQEYIPELDLAAYTALPDPLALVTNYADLQAGVLREAGREVPVQIVRGTWNRWPDLMVYGPLNPPHDAAQSLLLVSPDTQNRETYSLVCGHNLFLGRLAFYASPDLARRFTCPN